MDYPHRLSFFWASLGRRNPPCNTARQRGDAATACVDLESQIVGRCGHGETCVAARVARTPVFREKSEVKLPRPRRVLESWHENSPKCSRLPRSGESPWVGVAASRHPVVAFAMHRPLTALLTPQGESPATPHKGRLRIHASGVACFVPQRPRKRGGSDEVMLFDGDECDEFVPFLQDNCGRMVQCSKDENWTRAELKGVAATAMVCHASRRARGCIQLRRRRRTRASSRPCSC